MVGTHGKILEERSGVETMKELGFLTCSLWIFSAYFLIPDRTTFPGMAPTVGGSLSHKPLNKKMSYRLTYKPVL